VIIEDDVWMASNAVVLPGCRVARGAVVAAGAVVTRDVGPYEIVGGVPARVIGRRFDEQRAARLAAIDWPSWSDEQIRRQLGAFYDPDAFVKRFGRGASGPDPT
jgi:serine acetyltransferase